MKKIYSLLLVICCFSAAYSNVIYVDINASGGNNGSSWTDAYTSLQDAITNSVFNDTIWVAAGTYYPDEGVGFTNDDRSVSFALKDSVTILGGFNGAEVSHSQRDWESNICILSGDIDQSGDTLNNSNTVVISAGVNSSARLDGFTITMGNNYLNNAGGGVTATNSNANFENLLIIQNFSDAESGGALVQAAGGFFASGAIGPVLRNSRVSDNYSMTDCYWTSTSISSRSSGGVGVICRGMIMYNVEIDNNTAESVNTSTGNGLNGSSAGGGVSFFNGPNYMINCVVRNNSAETTSEFAYCAGGISLQLFGAAAQCELSNIVVEGNTGNSTCFDTGWGAYGFSAGGIFVYYCDGTFINNATVTNNHSEATGPMNPGTYFGGAGGIFNGAGYSTSTINNSIVHGNTIDPSIVNGSTDYFGQALISGFGGFNITFNNCLFDDYTGGVNSVVGNPDFRNTSDLVGPDGMWFTSDDGLHISCNSDAIDNGDQALLFPDFIDLDGDLDSAENMSMDHRLQTRVHNGQVDIGAFEFQGLSTSPGAGTDVVTAACGYVWIDGNVYTSDNNTATHTIQRGPDECDSVVSLDLTVIPLTDLTPSATSGTLCFGNTGTTITTASSDNGVQYVLRDDANDTIVDGPFTGDGNALSFNTGALVTDMTYNVYAANSYDGSAIDLPGANDHVRFATPFTAYTNEITIESWVNFNNGEHPWAGQSTPAVDNAGTNVWLWHAGSFYVNDNGSWRSLNFPSLPTGWTHIATVADANGLYIYYDGVLVASNTNGIVTGIVSNPNSVIDLGHDVRFPAGIAGRNTNTAFDDFRVWNAARTGIEINSNMNTCLLGSETNLVQLTQFEEGAGNEFASTTGSDGELINASTNWVSGSGVCGFNCDLELTNTITVTVLPEKTGVENSTICDEETIMVNGTAYNAANPTGTEVFTNIGPAGCDSTVTINLTVLAPLDSTLDSTICSYDSIVVNGTTYNASNPAGTEVFTNIGPNGCDSTVTINLTVTTIDLTVTNNAGMLSVAEVGADSYQWFECDKDSTIASATNQSYTPATGGVYGVEVSLDGCVDSSMCENVSFASLTDIDGTDFLRIYPNPTEGELNIKFTTLQSDLELTLRAANGQILKKEKLNNVSTLNYRIDQADGLYFIEVRNQSGEHAVFRVIKK